jgi:hypothetical protein
MGNLGIEALKQKDPKKVRKYYEGLRQDLDDAILRDGPEAGLNAYEIDRLRKDVAHTFAAEEITSKEFSDELKINVWIMLAVVVGGLLLLAKIIEAL